MINLLAYDKKKEIRAGRTNVIIRNYILLTSAGFGLLAVILVGAYISLNLSHQVAQDQAATNSSEINKFKDTESEAAAFRSNLSTAKTILDGDIAYSSLFVKIGQAVPKNVILDSLQLSPDIVGQATTLSARAKTYDDALALKTNLQNRPELFSNVSLNQVSDSEGEGAYPLTVSITVTFVKGALSS